MRIDAHQHFWQYDPLAYSWIGEHMKVLRTDFLPADLQSELTKNGMQGSIVVQARQTPEETEWLLALASGYDFIKGVVGWVDLCSEDVEDQLKHFSKHPKLVGVRHVIHDEPDDRFMARADFQHGIGLLEKYRLTFDILIFPKHMKLAAELVKRFPKQKFVLDHIGKPLISEKGEEPWSTDIMELAKFPNVSCKLSGMVTEADWQQWKPSDFSFYLDTVFKAFGQDRIMIGSDWPVCTLAGTYHQVISLVSDYVCRLENEARDKIFGLNCLNFYMKK